MRSGNNEIQYTYDNKRRLKSVNLNGKENYVQYDYQEKVSEAVNGSNKTVNKATATYAPRNGGASEVFITCEDLRGNVLKTTYGTNSVEYIYDTTDRLTGVKDKVSGTLTREYAYTYDTLDRMTAYTETKGSEVILQYARNYNNNGRVDRETIAMNGTTMSYEYSYEKDSSKELISIVYDKLTIKPKKDCLGRNRGTEIWMEDVNGTKNKVSEELITYRKIGDHATTMPSTVRYGDKSSGSYALRDSVKYTYDEMGNISKVYENGDLTARYTYDQLNRLAREDNKEIGKTYLYTYDNNGNILTKRTLGFTLKEKEEIEELSSEMKQYTYEGDKLLSYGTEAFTYDELGNPTVYRNRALTWEKGRQLKTIKNGSGTTTTFVYDGQGRRNSKQTESEAEIVFTYGSDGRLLRQRNSIGSVEMKFIYDEKGLIGVDYQGECYTYRKDILGNILGILDKNGKLVVRYRYDAWGKHKTECLDKVDGKEVFKEISGSISEEYLRYKTFAANNPFRYRSYYYDTETGLYFLQTRYYDPEIGRFITIDDISYLAPDTINGLNLYAYCNNNPVMNVDPEGNSSVSMSTIIDILSALFEIGIGGTLALVGHIVKTAPRPNNIGIGIFRKNQTAYLGKLDKAANILGKVSTVVAVISTVISVVEGIKTGIDSGYSTGRIVSNAITDTVVFGGTTLILGAIGGKIGGLLGSVLPGLGNVIGAAIGFALGLAIGFLFDLEVGGKSIINHIRDGVYNFWRWLFG